MRRAAVLGIVVMSALFGCNRINPPSGPRLVIPPGFAFSAGQILEYTHQNFDQNHNPTVFLQHEVEVSASGLAIGGFPDAATVKVSTPVGSLMRIDTAVLALEGGRLLIYDGRGQTPGRYPPLPLWNTLLDLGLIRAVDTLLAFDSTFTLVMASGHILRDRVACHVETRYCGEDILSAFGSPIVNCFLFTRTVTSVETVDTAGLLLFQGPVITLLDSIWFGDGIGPVKMTSRGTPLGVDSLGLPFSLSSLQVVHTPVSHDSYEVHYARVGGRDSLALREPLFFVPPAAYTVISAYRKNF